MSVTALSKPDDETHDKEQNVYQLMDIIAEEVSDVDRAANRRTYLVIKRRTDMNMEDNLGPEVIKDGNGNLTALQKSGSDVNPKKDKTNKETEHEEKKQALVMPGSVKAALLRTTTEVLERLMSLVNAIKGAEETDEELDEPTPDAVGEELSNLSELLTSLLDEYPSPIAKAGKLSIPKPVKEKLQRTASEAADRIKSLLTAIKGAEETDEKLDKPTPDSVARELRNIAALLTDALEKYPAPVAKANNKGTSTAINKSGAKMASKRRDQLKSVIELLQKLLEEVMPEPSAPEDAFTNSELSVLSPSAARSAQDTLGSVSGLADVLKAVSSEIAELTSKVQGQDAEIARLKKSTGLPASREVEFTRKPRLVESISWPLDMNRPLSREHVAKEVSFFDD